MERARVDRDKTLLMICDCQERAREQTHGFDQMAKTIAKMIKAARILGMATLLTEQNGSGQTAHEVLAQLTGSQHLGTYGKDCFSMVTKETKPLLAKYENIILVGIEAHVCILQTALDLLEDEKRQKHVYILADAISACHELEIPLALDRMRDTGAVVTTSEAILFQLMGDGTDSNDKPISDLIKEERQNTAKALETLLPHPSKTAPI
ncbi:hypothetical protein IAU60_005301 [Kwoniella sp. DSM 27419]